MSKLLDNHTLYNIFRACRLCGSSVGYRMPIIQTVIPFESNGVEFRQKLKECLQLEVTEQDHMPPLICELCMEKVNEYYTFLQMCRQTHINTQKILGLPIQPFAQKEAKTECILGVTAPIFPKKEKLPKKSQQREVKDNKEAQKKKKNALKGLKKELETLIKEALPSSRLCRTSSTSQGSRMDSRSSSTSFRSRKSPPPARETRHSANSSDNISLRSQQQDRKPPESTKPKSILKKDKNLKMDYNTKNENGDINLENQNSLLVPRGKRTRERDVTAEEISPQKKIKITIHLPQVQKSEPKTRRDTAVMAAAPPPPGFWCYICNKPYKTSQALVAHQKVHTVTYTIEKLACNACGEWFTTTQETAAHHSNHKGKNMYRCRHCKKKTSQYDEFQQHVEKSCPGLKGRPDVKCEACWKHFPTKNLLLQHKCLGTDARPVNCSKCNRTLQTMRNLKKHEAVCFKKKDPKIKMDSNHLNLPPVQVRIVRCDTLLKKNNRKRYNVANLSKEFGLDRYTYYPYLSSYAHVKTESLKFNGMVSINKDIKNELYREEDYVHWDSDNSSDDEETTLVHPAIKKKKVPSLTALSLKTIFSRRCLGKVPKKLRRVKDMFNMEDDIYNINITNIISDLYDDCKVNYDSDSILDDGNTVKDNFRGADVGEVEEVANDKNMCEANVDKENDSGVDETRTMNVDSNNYSQNNGYDLSSNFEDNETEKNNSVECNGTEYRIENNGYSQSSEGTTDSEISKENSNHTPELDSNDNHDIKEKINGKIYENDCGDKILFDSEIGENANNDKECNGINMMDSVSMDVPDFNFGP